MREITPEFTSMKTPYLNKNHIFGGRIRKRQKKFTITRHRALLEFHPNPIRASVPEASTAPPLTLCEVGETRIYSMILQETYHSHF